MFFVLLKFYKYCIRILTIQKKETVEMIVLYLELLILSVLIIASLGFWWLYIKKQRNTHRLSTTYKVPISLLIVGAILGSILATLTNHFEHVSSQINWIVYFVCSLTIGIIPIFTAYTRDVKDIKLIYAFSFAAMCLPLWLLWFLIALILALSGKKISTKKGVKKHEK